MHRYLYHTVGVVLFFTILLSISLPASADIGPYKGADGAGIGPEHPTQVRMEDELVEIDIQPAVDEDGRDTSFALVTALFHMRNLGKAAEAMKVKFPLQDGNVAMMSGDKIKGFQAWVNDEPVDFTVGQEPFEISKDYYVDSAWAYFDAVFPQGELVTIRVSYILTHVMIDDTGLWFTYLLETGRGWQGTIGRAEIVASFPYPVSRKNILEAPAGSRLEGKQLHWVKEDFDPSKVENFAIHIAYPVKWMAAIGFKADVPVVPWEKWEPLQWVFLGHSSPDEVDGAYWSFAANCYRDMALVAPPGETRPAFSEYFADLGLAAYHRAVALDLTLRSPLIGLAHLLLWKAAPDVTNEERDAVLSLLDQALSLPLTRDSEQAETDDQQIAEIYKELQTYASPGETLPTLRPTAGPLPTQTVTAAQTARPTATRPAAPTLPPAVSLTATPIPSPSAAAARLDVSPIDRSGKQGWVFGAGAVGLLLAAGFGVWTIRRR